MEKDGTSVKGNTATRGAFPRVPATPLARLIRDPSRELDGLDGHFHAADSGIATLDSSEAQISRVALITGRPLYWDTRTDYSDKQADRLGELLEWCLELPEVSLGIDPKSLGLILRSVYVGLGEEEPVGVSNLLDRLGVSEEEYWEGDARRFYDRREDLLELVPPPSETPESYVWLESDEAKWWAETAIEDLKEHIREYISSLRKGVKGNRERLLRLSDQYRWTLFAPLEGSILLEHLKHSIEDNHRDRLLNTEACDARLKDLEELSQGSDWDSDPHYYWSWQLLNFDFSQHKLVNAPLLALWSGWPSATVWAPPPPEDYEANTPLSPYRAASLLEDIMRRKFEAFFEAARGAFGLGQVVPEFKDYIGHSAAFCFAELADPPILPEEYVRERRPATDLLAEKCLSSDDLPGIELPGEEAWGVLAERNLVALRREVSVNGDHCSRYLLLTVGSGSTSNQEKAKEKLARDLAHVTSKLTCLEFSYADEAKDIYVDADSIRKRQPLWKHILDDVQDLATIAKGFQPRLGWVDRAQVDDEFEKLLMRQRTRIKAKLDKELRGHKKILARAKAQDESDTYSGRTEEYLRQNKITFSPLSDANVPVLRDVLLKPFSYRYLDEQLQPSDEKAKLLKENVKEIAELSETVDNVLQSTEQRARESLTARTTALSALVGFLALAGLAEFIPGAQLETDEKAIEAVVQHLIIVGLIAVPLILLLYAVGWVSCRLPHCLNRFGDKAKNLRVYAGLAGAYSWGAILRQTFPREDRKYLADPLQQFADSMDVVVRQPAKRVQNTPDKGWKNSEKMDKKATELLCKLWHKTEQARDGHANPLMGALDDNHAWRNLLKPLLRASQFQLSSQPAKVDEWLRRTRYILYRNELFVLWPKLIPSPRLVCAIRYKSDTFLEESVASEQDFKRSMVSERGFKKSLRIIGFKEPEIERLQDWLSLSENQVQLQKMEIGRFVELLEERGVTANPQGRTPQEWEGPLKQPSVGWQGKLRRESLATAGP